VTVLETIKQDEVNASMKRTPRKATVCKTEGRGKDKKEKACRKNFKFNDLSSVEEVKHIVFGVM
jgi:hypothetical protein